MIKPQQMPVSTAIRVTAIIPLCASLTFPTCHLMRGSLWGTSVHLIVQNTVLQIGEVTTTVVENEDWCEKQRGILLRLLNSKMSYIYTSSLSIHHPSIPLTLSLCLYLPPSLYSSSPLDIYLKLKDQHFIQHQENGLKLLWGGNLTVFKKLI